jgi:hypothetical protein
VYQLLHICHAQPATLSQQVSLAATIYSNCSYCLALGVQQHGLVAGVRLLL